ncbi:MAG: cyclopropane-fatty-acyl-phospholipid synthase [Candidatus Magasanikbacteria bacterium RIFOXYC2_FULL_42_28]|uniref:Cyclopropane-fatty-acyl-phospholipid synthase n=1 Tax=Candidatus Magasanikbacteria bacterium RIFOXYC2_FULL_42_28 TaxID=1798704 RepID=A0A1F6NX13_9BACT|nr:MAG: cyclopropane-fatty-acyl-phospholipid synthase [Candidatus Magasanikbacteria bacterium RIFOXYC2_FULL_42_28]
MSNSLKDHAQRILDLADIKINGNRPWDIKVHNENTYKRVFAQGTMGLGESYMDGWWDVENLDQFVDRIIRIQLNKKILTPSLIFNVFKAKILNRQKKSRAFEVGEKHYDVGNDLYKLMLGKRMIYTSGYWKNTQDLDEAENAKLELVCKKINLEKGMTILDIGCGWASFAKYAAEKYDAKVTGVTVSKEQAELGKKLCAGLPVEIILQDYRDIDTTKKYDRVVSIGMIEHVGPRNYKKYFEIIKKCLKDDGLFLLESFSCYWGISQSDPFSDKYIFPNGSIPQLGQIVKVTEKLFVIEDCHNFGDDYDKTLMAWYHNFINNWDKVKNNYNEKFFRMWSYFLLSFAGLFRSRSVQNWHIVFSKKGVPGGYTSIR